MGSQHSSCFHQLKAPQHGSFRPQDIGLLAATVICGRMGTPLEGSGLPITTFWPLTSLDFASFRDGRLHRQLPVDPSTACPRRSAHVVKAAGGGVDFHHLLPRYRAPGLLLAPQQTMLLLESTLWFDPVSRSTNASRFIIWLFELSPTHVIWPSAPLSRVVYAPTSHNEMHGRIVLAPCVLAPATAPSTECTSMVIAGGQRPQPGCSQAPCRTKTYAAASDSPLSLVAEPLLAMLVSLPS